jgi:hypothetical protein
MPPQAGIRVRLQINRGSWKTCEMQLGEAIFAGCWLAQHGEIVHEYQAPAAGATRTRDGILNGIFKLAESQEQMADPDLGYLVGPGQRSDIAQFPRPERSTRTHSLGVT